MWFVVIISIYIFYFIGCISCSSIPYIVQYIYILYIFASSHAEKTHIRIRRRTPIFDDFDVLSQNAQKKNEHKHPDCRVLCFVLQM